MPANNFNLVATEDLKLKIMQTPKKTSNGSPSGVPQKISPRAVRKLKVESDSLTSTNQLGRKPNERSPKVAERKSPRSPVCEKKRSSRLCELESQFTQLKEELRKTKDQLTSSESWKKQAQEDAEVSKNQLLEITSKLELSEQQLREQLASEESRAVEQQKISQDYDQAWQSKFESVQQQHQADLVALSSALREIQKLKDQIEMVSDPIQIQASNSEETSNTELQYLKEKLEETLRLAEDMKKQITECKDFEAQAQALVTNTLQQLETAKAIIETLTSEGAKAMEDYNTASAELNQSRERITLLDDLIVKIRDDLNNSGINEDNLEYRKNGKMSEPNNLEAELASSRSEIQSLRSALESAQAKCHEEQARSHAQTNAAYELLEQVKNESTQSNAELEAELKKAKADVEELKANLMDKETELQGISEENEVLMLKLEKILSSPKEKELEKELDTLKHHITDLKANLMDKETEFQNVVEENKMLKSELQEKDVNFSKVKEQIMQDLESARADEREARVKLAHLNEESDRSSRKATHLAEQLDATQGANAEVEVELRKLKVQSNQWRKAAETAASMLPGVNHGKVMERSGSLDSHYSPLTSKIDGSPYFDDMDDDPLKKKKGNMLKKIGVLWKKTQK